MRIISIYSNLIILSSFTPKSRLVKQAAEAAKARMIEKLGEEGYAKHLADKKAEKEKKEAAARLVPLLQAAMNASGNGVADTLEGVVVGKTAIKNEWRLQPYEIEKLTPVDATKKLLKYNVAEVIDVAHKKGSPGNGDHISTRVKNTDNEKLYARYLHDKFNAQCEAVGDDGVVQSAYDEVRGKIEKAVKSKADAVKDAQAELAREKTRLQSFDDLVEGMQSGGGKKRPAASKAGAEGGSATSKENAENDSKKPAAKKQKVAKKKGLAKSAEAPVEASACRKGGRARKAVSYAESDSDYDEEN